ncbi:hypothetical protein ASZ90_011371 [hydrocarbon metagenome]|uniref:BioF2-like acetyltransferase domain-containing protein n=1 Tax=hydrocarbon metagenome TaxID=938273 RepID=A0A0W8FDF8_9ZZZZ
MEIAIATGQDAAEWDRIVDESSHGTIFHTWRWLKIVEKHTGSTLYPIVAYQSEKPAGIIPLFYQKNMQMGMVFSPPPDAALYYLGPILINDPGKRLHRRETEYRNFQSAVDRFIRDELRATYISISLPPGLTDPRPYKWAGYTVDPAYDYVLELGNGVDRQWRQLPKKVRQNVTRAEARGISVVEGGREALETLFSLMVKRYGEQRRVISVPKNYLLELYDQYPASIKVFLALHEDEPVAGVADIIYKDRLYSWIGNPKPGTPISPSPNDLLIWKEIQYGCNCGMQQYITMSAAGNERLHGYYSSKMNPSLQLRFMVKKYSPVVGIMERLYSGVLKPIYERFHTFDMR